MAGSSTYFSVRVKPSSKTSEIKQTESGWEVRLKSMPIDGKANEELLYLLSRHFAVSRSDIKIKSGKGSKMKLIQINGKGE